MANVSGGGGLTEIAVLYTCVPVGRAPRRFPEWRHFDEFDRLRLCDVDVDAEFPDDLARADVDDVFVDATPTLKKLLVDQGKVHLTAGGHVNEYSEQVHITNHRPTNKYNTHYASAKRQENIHIETTQIKA